MYLKNTIKKHETLRGFEEFIQSWCTLHNERRYTQVLKNLSKTYGWFEWNDPSSISRRRTILSESYIRTHYENTNKTVGSNVGYPSIYTIVTIIMAILNNESEKILNANAQRDLTSKPGDW